MHVYSRGSHGDWVHIELGIAQIHQQLSCHPAMNYLISLEYRDKEQEKGEYAITSGEKHRGI